jgi:hypothetical protein
LKLEVEIMLLLLLFVTFFVVSTYYNIGICLLSFVIRMIGITLLVVAAMHIGDVT